MSARSYISVEGSYPIMSNAYWELTFGFFTTSPGEYIAPDAVIVAVAVGVASLVPELPVHPAMSTKMNMMATIRENVSILIFMYKN